MMKGTSTVQVQYIDIQVCVALQVGYTVPVQKELRELFVVVERTGTVPLVPAGISIALHRTCTYSCT